VEARRLELLTLTLPA